ncbi:extracellular solute-binding protein [Sphaerisporangium sp. TRM90804]|uniref:ABC transporter substrate-binding protein n=1 Tax=Sphaerisporangium sp. TRM90804 TaxID=3031113 RepID=UPI00244892F0|nr:extracellular solute-binding protein [Sphaerisporangium sp. TRM90804]MDH2424902.1 extracellular solute-binding protein [Sphaerisporangium sp. TRM90804]
MTGARPLSSHRRAVAAVTAVLLALVCAACSSGGGGATSAGGGAALEMWTFKRTHLDALKQAAREFQRQTGVAVDVQAVTPDDAFTAKVQSAAQTRSLPDVLEVHAGGEDFRIGGAGLLADLAGDFPAAALGRFLGDTPRAGLVTEERKRQVKELKDAEMGSLFSIPFTAGTFGIVYAHREKLEAAGLDPAVPPKTWQEFIRYLKATTGADPRRGGLALGLKVSQVGFNWIYSQLAFAHLGKERYQRLFARGAAQGFASPDGAETLALYGELTPYWMPGTTALGIDEADVAFAQGKAAFNVGGTFTLAFLAQNGVKPGDLISFPIPPPDGAKVADLRLAPLALTGLSVTSTSGDRAAAVKWVDFLTSPAGAGIFAKAALDLPATDLGADAEKLVGADLAALQRYFTGPADSTFDAADGTFRPPGYDEAKIGPVLLKLSPLRETDPVRTGAQLDAVLGDMWKSTS